MAEAEEWNGVLFVCLKQSGVVPELVDYNVMLSFSPSKIVPSTVMLCVLVSICKILTLFRYGLCLRTSFLGRKLVGFLEVELMDLV